ncbi:hypothetical protein AB4Z52_25850 [Rhizobium sp. 2YAF20]|uniref:hypothetical protein n=1 Tax=Rhizobium sp. 2YAF20 TaxID=3233027 RepID=UPI003F9CBA39
MEKITSPQQHDDYPERWLDCESAVNSAFRQLVLNAVSAGWREAEVALVIAEIADEYVVELADKRSLPTLN